MKRITCGLLVVLLSISGIAGIITITSMTVTGYTSHAPIEISSDADFATQGWPGSGTESDPWVIENLEINGGRGIVIHNTDDYFIVRNCYVHNSTLHGISLSVAYNGIIENNIASYNEYDGFVISYSNGLNRISNNTFSLNKRNGIMVSGSSNCTITNNNVSNNMNSYSNTEYGGSGITVRDSRWCTILNNTVANDNISYVYRTVGINVHSSDNISILNNILHSNGTNDISLIDSKYNILSNNIMNDGLVIEGKSLECWNTHTIDITNTIRGKPIQYHANQNSGTISSDSGQIILANSSNIIVENQNISNTVVGIELFSSSGNTIRDNIFSENLQYGIRLINSNGNTLQRNEICNNFDYSDYHYFYQGGGIYLLNSDDNIISENDLSNNGNYHWGYCDGAMYLETSNGNKIDNNTISNQATNGIYLSQSNNSLIYNNSIVNNTDGITVHTSKNNVIDKNYVSDSHSGISILFSSNQNTVSNNVLTSNRDAGIGVYESANNTIINNRISFTEESGIIISEEDNPDAGNNIVSYNEIANNQYGISIYICDGNEIKENNITSNEYGIYISDTSCYNNLIYHNNIINNTNQALDEGLNFWDNGHSGGGNYWSDYSGSGPYIVPGASNKDNYPLTEPRIFVYGDANKQGFITEHPLEISIVVIVIVGIIGGVYFIKRKSSPPQDTKPKEPES